MNDPTLPTEKISVVVPLFNEEAVLPQFHFRLLRVMEGLGSDYEVIYVDDGSRDRSLELAHRLKADEARVGIVELSRNFGKEAALTAGLDVAGGDAVVIIDADLQDPPELIPALVDKWREGFDVVYATRTSRDGESFLKKFTAHWFYRLMGKLSDTEIPADTGDFRVMSRRAVAALGQLREQHRFMKGLYSWIGFRQTAVMYRRDARASGTTKFNYRKLLRFAVDGITAFSTVPLKFATSIGLLVAIPAFGMAAYIVGKTLLYGDPVHGYPSMMTVLLMLGGLQLVFLGILGEYVGRLFNEVKRRPVYLVASYAAPAGTEPSVSGVVQEPRQPARTPMAPAAIFHAPGRSQGEEPDLADGRHQASALTEKLASVR
ncbi:polyisoprenyl-phosphate glycosyltransferase [Cupriavidus metallidurans]|uniref:Glycosyltransferase n=2 Tax=Cupriavidus TaxID=106589 RepID=A0A3G8GUG4_9BURK|nr:MULTISPECIES: glycosyltransferase [Cupriavidus]AZG11926.1 glycosyltransferase [Cupriavidus pauculus]KAB0600888.1 glycosyltransferase family 2 protein [Cupriavidus pauculus]MDE4922466.1 glycosyltransferase family 2 protein [Cupriavidus metallidurans]QBP14602.1 glycosyltransferase [Cupriavidus metallidurans]UAL02631.1 glycosyltransferase family 2 protein [Cupriavidus pauculus]